MAHVKEISAKVSKIVNEFDLLLALKVQSLFIAGERGGGGDPKELGFIMTKFTRPPPPQGSVIFFGVRSLAGTWGSTFYGHLFTLCW